MVFGVIALLLAASAAGALSLGHALTAATLAVIASAVAATGAVLHTVVRHFQELEVQVERVIADRVEQEEDFQRVGAGEAVIGRMSAGPSKITAPSFSNHA